VSPDRVAEQSKIHFTFSEHSFAMKLGCKEGTKTQGQRKSRGMDVESDKRNKRRRHRDMGSKGCGGGNFLPEQAWTKAGQKSLRSERARGEKKQAKTE